MNKPAIFGSVAIVLILSAAPVTYSPQSGLQPNAACAQGVKTPMGGGCCRELGAICVWGHDGYGNPQYFTNYYFRQNSPC